MFGGILGVSWVVKVFVDFVAVSVSRGLCGFSSNSPVLILGVSRIYVVGWFCLFCVGNW